MVSLLEVWWLKRPFIGGLAVAMLAALVGAAALRGWVILTLSADGGGGD